MCWLCPVDGDVEGDGTIGLLVLSLIDCVVNRMDVVTTELEIVMVGQPGSKW